MPDGDITLSVTLSAEDIKAKSRELRAEVQHIFDSVSTKGLDKGMQNTFVKMDALVSKADTIIAKMREMETTKVVNPEYERFSKLHDELSRKFVALSDKQVKGTISPEETAELERLRNTLEGIEMTIQQMQDLGRIEIPLSEADPERYNQLANSLGNVNNKLATTISSTGASNESFSRVYHTVRTIVASVQSALRVIENNLKKFGSRVKSVFNTILKSARKIASQIKGAFSNVFSKLSKESNSAFSVLSAKNLKKGLNTLLKYGLGVRSLYFLFRKLRTAIKEGLQNLVKFESAMGTSKNIDSVNTAITNLNTSLLYLKNAWAVAIAPIITAVMPVLTALMDKFAEVGNTIARFVGALTGQSIVLNAVKVDAQDYAESLGETEDNANGASGATKKLTDRLASFDDLNVLGKDNESGGGGGSDLSSYIPDPSEMFEYVDAVSDFATMLKHMWKTQNWKGVGQVIAKEIDNNIIKPIRDTLDWDNCKDKVADFINQWGNIINGFLETTELFDDIGTAIGNGITTASHSISLALKTLSLETLGDDIYRVFENAIKSVDEKAVAEAISEVFLAPLRIANGFFEGKEEGEVSKLFTDIGTKIATAINDIKWYDIFTGVFTFGSNVGSAIIDTIVGFINGGGFSGMLTQIAQAINDAVNKLTPEDFEEFGNTIGSLLVSVLSDINTFMGNTSDSFDTIVEGVGNALAELPWEDIFANAGEIAVKIINAIIKVLNVVGQHMNEVQDNGKTLAQNLGETIGECIKQINFEDLGEAFGLIAEGIIDGIISALENSDKDGIAGIIGRLIDGFKDADADTVETIANLAIWGTVAKAILTGITRALPALIASGAGQQIIGAIGSGLSSINLGSVAGGAWNVGAAGVGIGGAAITITGVTDAWRMMNDEIDETDFGGINEDVDTFSEGWKNAFSSFDQFRLTFAMGIDSIGEGIATFIGWFVDGFDTITDGVASAIESVVDFVSNLKEKWEELKDNLPEIWENIKEGVAETWDKVKEDISTKFEAAKSAVEETARLVKEALTNKWEEIKTDTEEKWNNTKEAVTTAFTTAKETVDEKLGLLYDNIKQTWEDIHSDSNTTWESIKGTIADKVENLKETLSQKWQDIKGQAYEKFVGIKTNIVNIFEQLQEAVKRPINGFIDMVESMINRVIEGINFLADKLNGMPDIQFSWGGQDYELGFSLPTLSYVSLPHLAQGAVIPPNREFMAVLGDQTSGTNIEAPLDTIKQAVAEELSAQMDVLTNGFASVVDAINNKNLVIGDKDIGKANDRYTNRKRMIRGTTF